MAHRSAPQSASREVLAHPADGFCAVCDGDGYFVRDIRAPARERACPQTSTDTPGCWSARCRRLSEAVWRRRVIGGNYAASAPAEIWKDTAVRATTPPKACVDSLSGPGAAPAPRLGCSLALNIPVRGRVAVRLVQAWVGCSTYGGGHAAHFGALSCGCLLTGAMIRRTSLGAENEVRRSVAWVGGHTAIAVPEARRLVGRFSHAKSRLAS